MSIKVTSADSVSALVYDRVHMEHMLIEQPLQSVDAQTPLYKLRIRYRLFAVDTEGQRHYQPGSKFVDTPDYLAQAVKKAATGDMDLVNAMLAIEAALASIITDQGDFGPAIITP